MLRFYGPVNPNAVMSSSVSLPNRTFTGQAKSSKQLTSTVHILLPETDNCPSSISGRERMTIERLKVYTLLRYFWSLYKRSACNKKIIC